MRLGLGLGLSKSPVASGASYGDADWANYDGTSDGAVQHFQAGGSSGPTAAVGTAHNEFVAVIRDFSGTAKRYANVYSVDGDTITEESTLELSVVNGTHPGICKLTDSRILAMFTANNQFHLFLLSKSGTTLVELDYDDGTGTIGSGENFMSIRRLTDTKALMFYDDDTNGGVHSVVIDLSGDTISYGTPVDTLLGSAYYGAFAVLSETEFVAAYQNTVFYYTISGTTITLGDSIDIVVGGGNQDDMIGMEAIDADTVLLLYEDDNAVLDTFYANTFSVSGGSLSRGTAIVVTTGTRHFGGPQGGKSINLGNRQALFVATEQDTDLNNPFLYAMTVDESNVITLNARVDAGEIGDHPTLCLLPDTNATRAVLFAQDSTTTPADKVAMKIIHGD